MQTFVVIAVISMGIYILKLLIDINLLAIKVVKNSKVKKEENELDEDYQFIKGLY